MLNKLYFSTSTDKVQQKSLDALKKEQESIGYYHLPDQETTPYKQYAKSLDRKIDTIAIIGIGGSSLGTKAIYHFLKETKKPLRKLLFIESTDPIALQAIQDTIDLNKTHFLVISKSGTTIETIALFKYIFALTEQNIEKFTFITDKDSPLDRFAQKHDANIFHIPGNVGGRFSVLSAVGLVPLALAGIDIDKLLEGAKSIQESFFHSGYMQEKLLSKAYLYAKHHAKYHINCIFAYSELLRYFCEWYVQLWGESLGKRQRHSAFHVGLTPIGLIGPKDQHSFLQLIMEGTRDKTVTFINIENFENSLSVPNNTLQFLETLNILDGITFQGLITKQCEAVMEAILSQGDIPVDSIILEKIDEKSIGEVIFYYELLTSLTGYLIDVNTYNQPGVELGKKILKQKLNTCST